MIKYFIKLIIYKFFTKINNDYITFISFNGKYADSPKAITKCIHEIDKSKKLFWLVNNVDNEEIPSYVKKIKYNSFKAWICYCKSKIIIDNVFCMHEYYYEGKSIKSKIKYKLVSFLKNKKGQRFYTTWHGTPIKKILTDSINSNITEFSCPNTTMFLDNKYAYEILNRVTFNKIKIVQMGSPKNDILFDKKISLDDLKTKLKLPINNKIILFAPTFRTDDNKVNSINRSGIDQLNMINIEELLNHMKTKFEGNWSLVCRFHYHVEKQLNWKELKQKYGNKIINGNEHDDIMEYLMCANVLITDMSSCLFDFALTEKPIFVFFPDAENYKKNERGLYFDISELPVQCATDYDSLLSNIDSFNYNEYKNNICRFLTKMGYIKENEASQKMAKYILEDGEKFE